MKTSLHNLSLAARLLAVAAASLVLGHSAQAADGTWTNLSGGLWSTSGNWSGGTIANGADFTANFGTLNITANQIISLDSARTIGNLIFSDTTTAFFNWTLDNNGSGANILTLSRSVGTPTITVNNQTANNNQTTTISLELAGTNGLTKAGAGTLTSSGIANISGGVTVGGGTLNFNGTGSISGPISNAATLTVGANVGITGSSPFVQSGVGAVTSLSGDKSAFSGPITINGGFVNATNSANTDVLQALGTGKITFGASSTLRLVANSSTPSTTTATAIVVGNDLEVAGPVGSISTIIGRRNSGSGSNKIFEFDTLTIGGGQSLATVGADGYSVRFTGATTLSGNAVLAPGAGGMTLAGGIGDGASGYGLAKTGAGTLFLTGASTYTGATTLFTGILDVGASGLSNSNLAFNGGVLQTTTATAFTRSLGTGAGQVQFGTDGGGFAARTAALTVNIGGASSTLIWNSTANFLGNGASLVLGSASANSTVTFENGIDLNGGARTITALGATGTQRISGAISDPVTGGSLVKSGAGALRLSGANTYAGATTVKEGALMLESSTGSLNSATDLTFTGTGSFDYNNTGAVAASSQTLDALTFSKGDGTVQASRVASHNVSLTLTSLTARATGATGNFVFSGGANGTSNKIVLGGVSSGQLLDRGLFFGGSSYAAYDAAGYVRALVYGTDTNTNASLTGAQTTLGTIGSTTGAQYVGSAKATTTSGGSASGTNTPTLVVSDGTQFAIGQVITGTNITANTYITNIVGNTLTLSQNIGGTAVAAGTVLTPYNLVSAQTTGSLNTLNLSGVGASLQLASSQTLTLNGILRSNGPNVVSVISGGTGITTGSSNDLVVRTDLSTDALVIATPILSSTTGGLVKSGAGSLTLRGANAYTGTTYVNAGTLALAGIVPASTTLITGDVEINGGTLSTTAGGSVNAIAPTANVTLNSGTFTQQSGASGSISQTLNNFTQNGGTTGVNSGQNNATVTVNGTTTLNSGIWTVGTGGGYGVSWLTNAMQINGGVNTIGVGGNNSGTTQLTVSGGLTITQTATGPFTALTIANGTGTNNSVTPQMLLSGGGLTYTSNANNPYATTIASSNMVQSNTAPILRLTGTQTFNIGGHTGSTTPDLIIQPNITTGGINKTGAGILALEGANTYTGVTTVATGTLLVNGTHTGGDAYSVTGKLGGTGIIRLGTTVGITANSGGLVAPGASIGTLVLDGVGTTGALLTMSTDSRFSFELGTSMASDKINLWNYVNGDFVLNSNAVNFTLDSSLVSGTHTFNLFNFYTDGGNTLSAATFSGLVEGTKSANMGTVTFDYTTPGQINMSVIAIPEPSTWALLAFSLTTVIFFRRRRA